MAKEQLKEKKVKKPFHKRVWVWVAAAILAVAIIVPVVMINQEQNALKDAAWESLQTGLTALGIEEGDVLRKKVELQDVDSDPNSEMAIVYITTKIRTLKAQTLYSKLEKTWTAVSLANETDEHLYWTPFNQSGETEQTTDTDVMDNVQSDIQLYDYVTDEAIPTDGAIVPAEVDDTAAPLEDAVAPPDEGSASDAAVE
jgi:hypothetical protein